jgi:hypothetical protein
MDSMLLSPRSVWVRNTKENPNKGTPGFRCCGDCSPSLDGKRYQFKLPERAVANGYWVGEAPKELQQLNPLELALASMARIDKHVFTFYGGCHKSLKGWHNMYEADVEHVAGSLMQMKDFGIGNHVACVLVGPFTSLQHVKAQAQCSVNPENVLKAMKWLIENNPKYKDCKLPAEKDLPKPLVIDQSELVAGTNSPEEGKYEYQVVFPELDDIADTNGGNVSQSEFKQKVIEDLDAVNDITLVSRPRKDNSCHSSYRSGSYVHTRRNVGVGCTFKTMESNLSGAN